MGRNGSLVCTGDLILQVPGFVIQTRDSTGAGDSFAAGFIAGYLGKLDWYSSTVLGNAMGAMAAARIGAGTAVPTAREVLSLLSDQRQATEGNTSGHRELVEAITQVIDFVTTLATEPEEEGKPWWK